MSIRIVWGSVGASVLRSTALCTYQHFLNAVGIVLQAVFAEMFALSCKFSLRNTEQTDLAKFRYTIKFLSENPNVDLWMQ